MNSKRSIVEIVEKADFLLNELKLLGDQNFNILTSGKRVSIISTNLGGLPIFMIKWNRQGVIHAPSMNLSQIKEVYELIENNDEQHF